MASKELHALHMVASLIEEPEDTSIMDDLAALEQRFRLAAERSDGTTFDYGAIANQIQGLIQTLQPVQASLMRHFPKHEAWHECKHCHGLTKSPARGRSLV